MTETLLVLLITSLSCGLIGSFLVLRRLSMVSDAISHSVLLGIVLAYFITHDITSPLLIVGAALFGVITVFSIEALSTGGLIKKDDAVGIVFPFFFALAVILITKYARNVHLDTDIVLMGEVILAPLNRMSFLGLSLPKGLVQMGIMLLLNFAFIVVFFKELKVSTFDEEFATISGFSAVVLFYMLMSLVSLTSVVAFDAVGAILVISFLITPGASAYLITKNLKYTLVMTAVIAAVNSFLGYSLSLAFNVSMSGMTAGVAGALFLLIFLFNSKGLITTLYKRVQRKKEFKKELFIVHVGNHREEEQAQEELGYHTVGYHLNWSDDEILKVSTQLIKEGLMVKNEQRQIFDLSLKGLERYERVKSVYGL